jgi:hypothetical protein
VVAGQDEFEPTEHASRAWPREGWLR